MLPALCFHIQKSPDQCLFASFPELIAGCRVFLRLSMPRHPPYTLGKLDLLDRGSIADAGWKACTTNPSLHKKVYFANRCSSDARSDGKTIQTIFQKQASQKSLILTRTSYLIVKEQSFLPPADFSISAINDPPSAGECVVCGLKRDGGLIQAFATSGRQMGVWGFCHRLIRRFHVSFRWGAGSVR